MVTADFQATGQAYSKPMSCGCKHQSTTLTVSSNPSPLSLSALIQRVRAVYEDDHGLYGVHRLTSDDILTNYRELAPQLADAAERLQGENERKDILLATICDVMNEEGRANYGNFDLSPMSSSSDFASAIRKLVDGVRHGAEFEYRSRVAELEGQIEQITRDRDVWKGMHEGLSQSYATAMQRISEQGVFAPVLPTHQYQVDPNDTGEWCKNCGIAKIKSTRTDCVWSGGASSAHVWVIGSLVSQSPAPSRPDTETAQ